MIVLLSLTLVTADLGFQDASPSAAPVASAPLKPVKPKKICRTISPPNSRVPYSECHTRAEWGDIENAKHQSLDQLATQVMTPR